VRLATLLLKKEKPRFLAKARLWGQNPSSPSPADQCQQTDTPEQGGNRDRRFWDRSGAEGAVSHSGSLKISDAVWAWRRLHVIQARAIAGISPVVSIQALARTKRA